jgi:hypothetical protein
MNVASLDRACLMSLNIMKKKCYKTCNGYKLPTGMRITRMLHITVTLLLRWCSDFVANVYENVANATFLG